MTIIAITLLIFGVGMLISVVGNDVGFVEAMKVIGISILIVGSFLGGEIILLHQFPWLLKLP